ncbi:MAG: phenylalanine--tRNA ligase subunit alpha [Deltaproteobacteria bacterium]|nr:phenylalanine--tRNA ligase subunit alpha [Deltaproteobacteria bacterium]
METIEQLSRLEAEARTVLNAATTPGALHAVKVRFLGRNGELTSILHHMGALTPEERRSIGRRANELKGWLEAELNRAATQLSARQIEGALAETVDVTLPGRGEGPGHAHPVIATLERITDIFVRMGFSIFEGPEIESDYYNFEALNMPADHPARDMHDTFYVETPGIKGPLLLRTHTSPVQIRVMESRRPPLRMIAPGAVYRRDADVTHSPMFHQVEGLLVDEGVAMSDLKGVLTTFVRELFGPEVPVRFRPSFFPFTEPSAEVDIGCVICRMARADLSKQPCRVCKGTGWLEILGAGMVHPAVFRAVRYDPRSVSGFAFGLGVERVAMLMHGIDDIRLFYTGDMRFLEQF